jgi:hypothetical protein
MCYFFYFSPVNCGICAIECSIQGKLRKRPPHSSTANKKEGWDLSLTAWLWQLCPNLLQDVSVEWKWVTLQENLIRLRAGEENCLLTFLYFHSWFLCCSHIRGLQANLPHCFHEGKTFMHPLIGILKLSSLAHLDEINPEITGCIQSVQLKMK